MQDSTNPRSTIVPAILLETLSSDHREIYLLWCEGLRYVDIASELNVPLGTVRSRINRARTQLGVIASKSEAA